MLIRATFAAAIFAALIVHAPTRCEATPSGPAGAWQRMARADLDEARRLIEEVHPGIVDEENPGFSRQMTTAHEAALELIPAVNDYSGMLYVVRYFLTAFEDGHLNVSDDVRPNELLAYPGWTVRLEGSELVVAATRRGAGHPAIGDKVVACDGTNAKELLEAVYAPSIDRRPLESSRRTVASVFGLPSNALGRRLSACTFTNSNGERKTLKVNYNDITFLEWVEHLQIQRSQRANSLVRRGDVAWLRISSMNASDADLPALEERLETMRSKMDVRAIVFDLRDNAGGDSRVGELLAQAATGGLVYDQTGLDRLPRTYALWRVSRHSLMRVRELAREDEATYGAQSPQAHWSSTLLTEFERAHTAGERWARQPGDEPRLTREDIQQRGGKLAHFNGRVLLITGSECASACLDLAEALRLVPGALHLGEATSADTAYIDVGTFTLPSGNALRIPMKVWRNRPRGSKEPLRPDIPCGISDDESARKCVASALEAQPKL